MDEQTLLSIFPRASRSTIAANLPPHGAGPAAKLERDTGAGTLGPKKAQGRAGTRFLVRVTSVRRRLLDEDNLCEKYHVDLLRYAGVIASDSPGSCRIETTQRKAEKGEAEMTVLEVFEING